MKAIQKPWRRIRKEAELEDILIHDLRHSFVSVAVVAVESLPIIEKLLGHMQVQTTARYAYLEHDPKQNTAERVSGDSARLLDTKSDIKSGNTPAEAVRSKSPFDGGSIPYPVMIGNEIAQVKVSGRIYINRCQFNKWLEGQRLALATSSEDA